MCTRHGGGRKSAEFEVALAVLLRRYFGPFLDQNPVGWFSRGTNSLAHWVGTALKHRIPLLCEGRRGYTCRGIRLPVVCEALGRRHRVAGNIEIVERFSLCWLEGETWGRRHRQGVFCEGLHAIKLCRDYCLSIFLEGEALGSRGRVVLQPEQQRFLRRVLGINI